MAGTPPSSPSPTATSTWMPASAGQPELGLAVHLPPDPLASIHYPGWTYFVVITKAGVTVKWLPDQDGRLAERWAARKAAA